MALKDFYVTLRVVLKASVTASTDHRPGYYVNIGVTAENIRRAKSLVSHSIRDGTIDWKESQWLEPDSLDPEITKSAREAKCPIIWYKSGRTPFPEKTEDEIR